MKTPKSRREKTSEAALIGKLCKAAPHASGRNGVKLGIGDDAALFMPRRGHETILTCDWFLEGTHFLQEVHPADAVGWKSLARAVSDIAAMGGEPRCFLLSLALPETHAGRWLSEFLAGLRRAARKFDCPLAGGDTTRQSKILINITVVGEVRPGHAVLRSGAQAGDILYVSGRLGEAELGLSWIVARSDQGAGGRGGRHRVGKTEFDAFWSPAACRHLSGPAIPGTPRAAARSRQSELLLSHREPRLARTDPALQKHLYPESRIALGRWLAGRHLATSMMDLSDGLSTDLTRLCAASRVGARIEAAKIPTVRLPERTDDKRARFAGSAGRLGVEDRSAAALNLALNGGDDYELLFTLRRGNARRLPHSFRGVPLTPIGVITRQPGVILAWPDGRAELLRSRGWDPFRKRN